MLLIFVVGDILGAGIYALVGEVAGEVGGAIWSSFSLAFALAFLTAFAYAELVTKYPHAAGAALYINQAFKRPFVTFLVTVAVMASGITFASTAARAFGGDYLKQFIEVPVVIVALGFVVILALINFRGIKESVQVNVGLTFVEAGGLLFVMVIGAVPLLGGEGDPARAFEFTEGTSVPLAILGGATLSFFAFIGFEDSVNIAEETREPRIAYPRALFGGLIVTCIIYLLVTFTAGVVVPTQRLADSSGPLLEVVEIGAPAVPPRAFSVVALLAVTNTALINMIMASRLLYGMANQGIVPKALGKVHPGRRTPYVSIVLTTLIAAALVTTGEIEALADTTVLLLLAVFALVNVSVLVLKRDRVERDHFVSPSPIPVLGAAVCLGLMTQQEAGIYLRAAILIVVGVGLYLANYLVTGRAAKLDATELRR